MTESAPSYVAWSIAPVLAPYVADMFAYDMTLPGPGMHRGLPSTSLTFVLPVGEPLDVCWGDQPGTRRPRWSTVSGLHTRPAEIHHEGRQAGIQLGLTPAGARALLGVPAAELSAEILELEDVNRELSSLPERLAESATWVERLRIVEGCLLAALAHNGAPGPRAEVGQALARLTGGASVRDVADHVGVSRRHLSTLVRNECGVTPKAYQRIARFEASRAAIARGTRPGRARLADIAADLGYADQAHLTREWIALAGCTPTTWLRTEFPFLQDLAFRWETD